MANTFMTNVPANLNMAYLGQRLQEIYRAKGYNVSMVTGETNLRIQFDKNCGGINMLLGLGKGITANRCREKGSLMVNDSDGNWTGKIIGLAIGWVLCWIPFITAISGCVQRNGRPNEISNDIRAIVNGL